MGLVSILSISSGILIGFLLVGLGVFIARYKTAFNHIKKSTTNSDPLDDLEIESGDQREGFFTNLGNVFSDSFILLVAGKEKGAPLNAEDAKVRSTILFIGQGLIILGYLTALSTLVGGYFLLSVSNKLNYSF
jgi:hypothetical protein